MPVAQEHQVTEEEISPLLFNHTYSQNSIIYSRIAQWAKTHSKTQEKMRDRLEQQREFVRGPFTYNDGSQTSESASLQAHLAHHALAPPLFRLARSTFEIKGNMHLVQERQKSGVLHGKADMENIQESTEQLQSTADGESQFDICWVRSENSKDGVMTQYHDKHSRRVANEFIFFSFLPCYARRSVTHRHDQ